MVNNYMYSHNRYNNTTQQSSFTPSANNWFISAQHQSSGDNYYFPNLTSYNNWAGTCCGGSYNAVTSGKFGDYNIQANKF